MRKTILIAATVLALAGGAGALTITADAQQAPDAGAVPPGPPPGPAGGPGGWHHPPGPGGWHGMGWMHHRPDGMGAWHTFALFHPPVDRQLSGADVQAIAQGFLLWQGNHTWKVADVSETDANAVAFAITTQSGDVVARFTMDRHTGRVQRTG